MVLFAICMNLSECADSFPKRNHDFFFSLNIQQSFALLVTQILSLNQEIIISIKELNWQYFTIPGKTTEYPYHIHVSDPYHNLEHNPNPDLTPNHYPDHNPNHNPDPTNS